MHGVLGSKTPPRRCAHRRWVGAILAFLAMLAIGPSPAQEPEPHPGSPTPEAIPKPAARNAATQAGPHPGLPPPEAITACASKLSGAPCHFKGGDRTITGTCQTKMGQLVCVPDRPPPGPPGGAGESTPPRGEDGPRDSTPAGPPRDRGDPGSSGQRSKDRPPPPLQAGPRPPPAAFEACTLASEGSRCVVQTSKGNIAGACGLYQGRLACIPARPSD